jgi:hypothetical protein
VDYQHWLKAYGSELALSHPGVALSDVDSLYIQSLYFKNLSPADAAKLGVMYKEQASDIHPGEGLSSLLDRVPWDAALLVAGLFLFLALLVGPRVAGYFQGSARNNGLAIHGTPKSNGSFYASDHIYIPASPASLSNRTPSGLGASAESSSPWPAGIGYQNPYSASPGYRSTHPITRHSYDPPATVSVPDLPTASHGSRSGSAGGGMVPPAGSPIIEQFDITTSDTTDAGLTGTVTWRIANADSVQLFLLGQPILGATDLNGSIPFDSLTAGSIFTIRAIGGGHMVEQSASAEPN